MRASENANVFGAQ